MDERLLEILVCPLCKDGVVQEGDGLLCPQCGRLYPVRDGIPVMIVEEASAPRETDPGAEVDPAEATSDETGDN